jgi:hypothetical protein
MGKITKKADIFLVATTDANPIISSRIGSPIIKQKSCQCFKSNNFFISMKDLVLGSYHPKYITIPKISGFYLRLHPGIRKPLSLTGVFTRGNVHRRPGEYIIKG